MTGCCRYCFGRTRWVSHAKQVRRVDVALMRVLVVDGAMVVTARIAPSQRWGVFCVSESLRPAALVSNRLGDTKKEPLNLR